jgi:hypothetical protein
MKEKNNKLLIKNMVCQRCILTVKTILTSLGVLYDNVVLGEVGLIKELKETKVKEVEKELNKLGFELIETRLNKIIEDIKKLVLDYLNNI